MDQAGREPRPVPLHLGAAIRRTQRRMVILAVSGLWILTAAMIGAPQAILLYVVGGVVSAWAMLTAWRLRRLHVDVLRAQNLGGATSRRLPDENITGGLEAPDADASPLVVRDDARLRWVRVVTLGTCVLIGLMTVLEVVAMFAEGGVSSPSDVAFFMGLLIIVGLFGAWIQRPRVEVDREHLILYGLGRRKRIPRSRVRGLMLSDVLLVLLDDDTVIRSSAVGVGTDPEVLETIMAAVEKDRGQGQA